MSPTNWRRWRYGKTPSPDCSRARGAVRIASRCNCLNIEAGISLERRRPARSTITTSLRALRLCARRGDEVSLRDLFDRSLMIEREPQSQRTAGRFLVRHRGALTQRAINARCSAQGAVRRDRCAEATADLREGVSVRAERLLKGIAHRRRHTRWHLEAPLNGTERALRGRSSSSPPSASSGRSAGGGWRDSRMAPNMVMPIACFDRLGVRRFS